MEPEKTHLNARQYLESLTAGGRYDFDVAEAQAALGATSAKFALSRLAKQRLIVSPARGFYVIVQPEYRALGCPPADQFIPALMQKLGLSYYAGLLTAAQYHGAAHQRPQEFQVLLENKRLPISCGQVRVAFIVRKRLREVPVQTLNTRRGTLTVSTPEATAVDLVGYPNRVGGLSQVATVLSELAEGIDPEKLVVAAAAAPVPWAQRLGYLLERAGAADKASGLKAYVRARARESAVLLPQRSHRQATRDDNWKLWINAAVEPAS
jgi:predicted transcriptional regulator of viral defense system